MKADLYLKCVLTVIASCLLWLCVNGATPSVSAQGKPAGPMRVIIVDDRNVPLSTVQGLHVNVGLQTVPVSIAGPIDVRQPVEVRVLREPPTLRPTP
jgi:hypothetical protein